MTAAEEQVWVRRLSTGLSGDTEAYLLKAASDHPLVEVCGFITSGGTVIPMDNLYENPDKGFSMDRQKMVKVISSHDIAGVYHSHPSGTPHPSGYDTEHMSYLYQQGCLWNYYIIAGGKIRQFEHRDRQ